MMEPAAIGALSRSFKRETKTFWQLLNPLSMSDKQTSLKNEGFATVLDICRGIILAIYQIFKADNTRMDSLLICLVTIA